MNSVSYGVALHQAGKACQWQAI